MYNIEDYNYILSQDLIAQVPCSVRDGSRLLFVDRRKSGFHDYHFHDLPTLLRPGDVLVVNNTKVIPARIFGHKKSGGKVEALVLASQNNAAPQGTRWCLIKASKPVKNGTCLFFENDVRGVVEDVGEDGLALISFSGSQNIDDLMEEKGAMPLPPYIKRDNKNPVRLDRERYQTIFSREKGAVAAPTAGLHFTDESVNRLNDAGVELIQITLHVGHGTFRPVRTKDIRDHHLGSEVYIISPDAASAINAARRQERRIIAVGTTVVRTLESSIDETGNIPACSGMTELLITPGYEFKVVNGMITNFHLPRSSLLFLVSAFGRFDLIKEAYKHAVSERYRFFSYGDAMLIL